jgi:hypothetical protein
VDTAAAQHWLPVRIEVVLPAAAPAAAEVSNGLALRRVQALNAAFGASPEVPLRFVFESLRHHRNDTLLARCPTDPCYSAQVGPACGFSTVLLPAVVPSDRGSDRALTVVVCPGLPYTGEAALPWASPAAQYVQLRLDAFSDETRDPRGVALVHEVGHYLGLFHVFEGTCNDMGDWVNDTPPALYPAWRGAACGTVQDSCPQRDGVDDVSNYMNYAAELCEDHFTPLQRQRMLDAAGHYRHRLMAQTRAAPGASCPLSAAVAADCSCPAGAQYGTGTGCRAPGPWAGASARNFRTAGAVAIITVVLWFVV